MLACSPAAALASTRPFPTIGAVTVAGYAASWPRLPVLRPATRQVYEFYLRAVWLPHFGAVELADVKRRAILAVLEGQRARGLKPGSVRAILGVFRVLLEDARNDGLVLENAATRLGRLLGKSEPRVEPMDRATLTRFLDTTAAMLPERHALFLTLARAGLRIGEALALRPGDVDLDARQLVVAHTLRPDRTLGVPKTARSRRRVDLSRQLVLALGPLVQEPGRDWVFGTRHGPLSYDRARKDFGHVRDRLRLPKALSLHSLRHSYASLLIARGVSPAYVQRQLGHASIALTLDLYGRHLPYRDLAAVDGLDDEPIA